MYITIAGEGKTLTARHIAELMVAQGKTTIITKSYTGVKDTTADAVIQIKGD